MTAKSSKAPLTRPVLAAARKLGRPHVAVVGYVASARDFQPTAALRGAATIKLQTMARATGYCQRTVQRALDDLERVGAVQRVKRNRYAKSYRVADVLGVFPVEPSCSDELSGDVGGVVEGVVPVAVGGHEGEVAGEAA